MNTAAQQRLLYSAKQRHRQDLAPKPSSFWNWILCDCPVSTEARRLFSPEKQLMFYVLWTALADMFSYNNKQAEEARDWVLGVGAFSCQDGLFSFNSIVDTLNLTKKTKRKIEWLTIVNRPSVVRVFRERLSKSKISRQQ